jgi:hypothetical protein
MLRTCRRLELPLAPDADEAGIRAAVDRLAGEGRLVAEEGASGVACFLTGGDRRRFLEFNKNILLAHLLGPSLAALAERGERRADEELLFLESLFAEEFVFGPGFSDKARLPGPGSDTRVLASLLESFLEGYLVACRTAGSISLGEQVDKDDLTARCFEEGARMLAEGAMRRPESLSRIIFENSFRSFCNMGLLASVERAVDGGKAVTVLGRGGLFEERGGLESRIASFLQG